MTKHTIDRICELYMFHKMPIEEIARITKVSTMTVSRTIDRVLKFKKITDRGTEMITIQSKINNQIKE